MSLNDDLLRKGYFPENLPPPFCSDQLANHFSSGALDGYLSKKHKNPFRSASYNASKRGLSRRVFSVPHPLTAFDLAKFITQRWPEISKFFDKSKISFSKSDYVEDKSRAIMINSHSSLQIEKIRKLSNYRFIVATDIARFYHSIYTHSLPWAFHGKAASKENKNFVIAHGVGLHRDEGGRAPG